MVHRTTNEIRSALSNCIAEPPEDLVAFYERPFPENAKLRIKILDLPEAIGYTNAIHDCALLARPMGLFALNDANDSNPYCYVTQGPARGCILHLHHDDDPVIEYSSLIAFLNALNVALENNTHIDDLSGKDFRPKVDQALLCEEISRLIQTSDDEAECQLIIFAQLLDTARVDVVTSLAGHPSFFVREAVAGLIAKQPNGQLTEVAKSLADDEHDQVARLGKKALLASKHAAGMDQ